ncbi:hypothetical protein FF38_09397 [Lucilia cuprina]|uniref:Uncharacterized protein n=1 Tax=Lucilia cuprina TaxID=7375 RepID=A0A0L0CT32_LUCCU|nr:hypothetical protein FF38_09397 [Lucilia cuprina]
MTTSTDFQHHYNSQLSLENIWFLPRVNFLNSNHYGSVKAYMPLFVLCCNTAATLKTHLQFNTILTMFNFGLLLILHGHRDTDVVHMVVAATAVAAKRQRYCKTRSKWHGYGQRNIPTLHVVTHADNDDEDYYNILITPAAGNIVDVACATLSVFRYADLELIEIRDLSFKRQA